MKTEFKTVVKDNITTAAVLAATFVAVAGAVLDSSDANAPRAAARWPVQRMETITVQAPRDQVATLETVLVNASRDARILIALN
ncbi:MAG: hypothetical protein ABI790_01320 [Betaproteobacteria bacterium]